MRNFIDDERRRMPEPRQTPLGWLCSRKATLGRCGQFSLVFMIAGLLQVVMSVKDGIVPVLLVISILTVCLSVAFVVCKLTNNVPSYFTEVQTAVFTIFVVAAGVHSAATATHAMWMYFTLILGFTLTGRYQHMSRLVMVVAVVFLCLRHVNNSFQISHTVYTAKVPDVCNCASPPCKVDVSDSVLSALMDILFVLSMYQFVCQCNIENATKAEVMECTISTAKCIATCLSLFDLDAAEVLIHYEDKLPTEMRKSFQQLLENLRVYQPYLPQSCVPVIEGSEQDPRVRKGSQFSVFLAGDNGEIEAEECEDEFDFQHRHVSKCASFVLSRLDSHRRRISSVIPPDDEETEGQTSPNFHVIVARKKDLHVHAARLTLLMTNFQHSIRMLEQDLDVYEQGFSSFLQSSLDICSHEKGVVDLFIGDKVFVSFNAIRQCTRHARAASRSAVALLKKHEDHCCKINVGIITGKFFYGDLGCKDMRRATALGASTLVLSAFERAGKELGIPILCNALCEKDISFELDLILVLLKASLLKRGEPIQCASIPTQGACCRLWEVPIEQSVREEGEDIREGSMMREPTEWMYEMDNNERQQAWVKYNDVVRDLQDGVAEEEQLLKRLEGGPEQVAKFKVALEQAKAIGPCLRISM